MITASCPCFRLHLVSRAFSLEMPLDQTLDSVSYPLHLCIESSVSLGLNDRDVALPLLPSGLKSEPQLSLFPLYFLLKNADDSHFLPAETHLLHGAWV